jgi:eukaryotic-like serine/threonine-protein kinase
LITSDQGGLSFIDEPAFEMAARVLASDEPALAAGDLIDRYEVVSWLGSGGMGEVYLAHDEKLDRKIALKLLPSHFTTNQARLRRFQQEARAASALNHPNIIMKW